MEWLPTEVDNSKHGRESWCGYMNENNMHGNRFQGYYLCEYEDIGQ